MASSFGSWLRSIPILNRFNQGHSWLPLSFAGNGFSFKKITDRQAVEDGYMGNLNWYAIVKKAAEGAASLPYSIQVKSGEEWIEVDKENDSVAQFFYNPNQDQTLIDLLEAAFIYYYTTGEAFFVAPQEAIGFNSKEVKTIPPELMKIKMETDDIMSDVSLYEIHQPNGSIEKLTPLEVCHMRMFNPSVEGFKVRNGLSPLQAAYNKLRASNNQATGQAVYFENRGISTIVSPTGGAAGVVMAKSDKKAIDEATSQRVGGSHKVNGVITVTSPVQTSQLGSSASDMQMLEQGTSMLRELCNALFMPSEMFNDPDNKTHANRKEAVKTMYHDVFLPAANRFMRAYEKAIIKPYGLRENGKEYRITVDTSKIEALQPDPFEKKRMLLDEVERGVISRNEYREAIGREPLTNDGMDEPTVQQRIYTVNPSMGENS